MPTEDEKRRERSHAVGLFRYQLICPALDAGLSTKARGRIVREIAAREHTNPFGTPVRYSRDTLDRWIRRYRAGGFVELIPSPRSSAPRTDVATLDSAPDAARSTSTRTGKQRDTPVDQNSDRVCPREYGDSDPGSAGAGAGSVGVSKTFSDTVSGEGRSPRAG